MSANYPIIAITGSSGSGTTSVMNSFQHIFRREGIKAQMLEGDSMHRYERKEMDEKIKEYNAIPGSYFSHFSPKANLLPELEATFKQFGETGICKVRKYLHSRDEAAAYKQEPGTLTTTRIWLSKN